MSHEKVLKIGILIAVLMICGLGILLWYRFDRCMITQFQDTTGSQGMFYTIENDGKLIVIDGGNPGNAEFVSQVIEQFGGHVDARSHDLCNDGSMLFKVTHRKESMLFCSDVGISLSDLMLAEYGEELKSEYLQMGHHGYGGLSDAFYTMVAPKAAFFDAPEWLMHPSEENSSLNTPEKIRLMESLGAEIFYYEGAPHRFQLK